MGTLRSRLCLVAHVDEGVRVGDRLMSTSLRSQIVAFALALLVLPALLSCGGRERSSDHDRVVVRGSDTMTALLELWATAYPAANVEVSGGGTGVGIAALTNGAADIAAASRSMTSDEQRRVEAKRGPIARTIVAIDAVAIYVNVANPVHEASLDAIKRIYHGETSTWRALDDGGALRPIARYSRENTSGTYAFFKDEVLEGSDFSSDVQCLPGTAAVVRAVARDPFAIGYGGIASARGVRALSLRDPRSGETSDPTLEDVTSRRYPLTRPLFLYYPKNASEAALRFVRWVSTAEAARALTERAGFVAAPREAS